MCYNCVITTCNSPPSEVYVPFFVRFNRNNCIAISVQHLTLVERLAYYYVMENIIMEVLNIIKEKNI